MEQLSRLTDFQLNLTPQDWLVVQSMVGFPPDKLLDDRSRCVSFGHLTNFNRDCTKEFIHAEI